MNCKQCQQKILESLAAGQDVLAFDAARHQESCEVCREFRRTEQTLFTAIDVSLRSLANQPVPPSLLPSVRTLMDKTPAPNRTHFNSWAVAAVTAAALLTVNFGYRMRHPANSLRSTVSTSVASRNVDIPQKAPHPDQQPQESLIPAPKIGHSAPANSTATPEVIVLAEEREAFAKFVSAVPEEPNIAQALACPTPAASGDAVEIALLQIDELEVKPLEGTATE
jgi:hypothetical protein